MEGGSVILGMQADRKTKVLEEYYNYMNVGDTITARINGGRNKELYCDRKGSPYK